ncbi:MAG: gamma-glutamyltransferase family protein [Hyphomicrobiales bacterium]|nr:gamma-glutamyltransferase family protein [Hyphomicrobiales bacterium]
MLTSTMALGGMVVAPHHLAAQAGRDILRDGGSAIEAMVAAAATIAVVYPHMNALGGDGFWLIHRPGEAPLAIDASGPAVALAHAGFYKGDKAIPTRGPKAALTVAGTVAGWQTALDVAGSGGARVMTLERLLADAIRHAEEGVAITRSQAALSASKLAELRDMPGFAPQFLREGAAPRQGDILRQPGLAASLRQLARHGLDDFYRGHLARRIADGLEACGSPLRRADLAAYRAQRVTPLRLDLAGAQVFNLPPSTQGLASLMILGLFERLGVSEAEGFAHLHGLVEATKAAFRVRDKVVTDPARVPGNPAQWLAPAKLDALASTIDKARAAPWPHPAQPGDTVWLGAIDRHGCAVSFIQSVFFEFGSGVVAGDTGILWQNRGSSFSLDAGALNALEPGRKPFHTLNPALALFHDGRVMPYGCMGGEGQPQTQAALFTRYAHFGQDLQSAVSAPRWLLGRTWGESSTTLKLESRFDAALVAELRASGHVVDVLDEAFSDTMGHAGALVRHPDGLIEGAADPRSDGAACGV